MRFDWREQVEKDNCLLTIFWKGLFEAPHAWETGKKAPPP